MPKSKEFLSSSGSESESSDSEPKPKKSKKSKKAKKEKRESEAKESPKKSATASGGSKGVKGDDGSIMYPLSHVRNVSVSSFRGKALINIREYYEKDGKMLPGKKGISLTLEQWMKLKSYVDDIDNDLKNV